MVGAWHLETLDMKCSKTIFKYIFFCNLVDEDDGDGFKRSMIDKKENADKWQRVYDVLSIIMCYALSIVLFILSFKYVN